MKKNTLVKPILLSMLLFFASSISFAQKLIMPTEVSAQVLKNLCEDAGIKVEETKDTYIKIKETFTIYLDIDKDKRFVYLNINYPLVDGTTATQAMNLINKFNQEIILLRTYYNPDKNTITYGYDFWIENGFTNRTFINVVKMFAKGISLSLDKDTGKLIK